MPNVTTETKTPYGIIFRSGKREWFPGSVEEFRTAKAWGGESEKQKRRNLDDGRDCRSISLVTIKMNGTATERIGEHESA